LNACQAPVDYKDFSCEDDHATLVAEVTANRNQQAPQLQTSLETSMADWSVHLSEFETNNLDGYSKRWKSLHGTDPNYDERALFVLSQNWEDWCSSSGLSGTCPTFTRPAIDIHLCLVVSILCHFNVDICASCCGHIYSIQKQTA
jgi:hypothetical protein